MNTSSILLERRRKKTLLPLLEILLDSNETKWKHSGEFSSSLLMPRHFY